MVQEQKFLNFYFVYFTISILTNLDLSPMCYFSTYFQQKVVLPFTKNI